MRNYLNAIYAKILYITKGLRCLTFKKGLKYCGKNVRFYPPLTLEGKEYIQIGDNTAIGTYVHIWGHGDVNIGNNVAIAAHCCITSLNHDYSHELIRKGPIIKKQVTIEDDVWLGYGVIVLPGVTIGRGAVIGAGSVVANDIPAYSIAIGNPAKIIKKRICKSS